MMDTLAQPPLPDDEQRALGVGKTTEQETSSVLYKGKKYVYVAIVNGAKGIEDSAIQKIIAEIAKNNVYIVENVAFAPEYDTVLKDYSGALRVSFCLRDNPIPILTAMAYLGAAILAVWGVTLINPTIVERTIDKTAEVAKPVTAGLGWGVFAIGIGIAAGLFLWIKKQ